MSAPDGGRRAVLVLGMHRSGTSALARVLSLRGVDLPAHLMAPNRGNQTGYWEPAPIVAFNDELLDYFGTAWDDPFAAVQLPEPGLVPRRFHHRARALLEQEFGDSRLFVLKDPRNCLLGPFWSQVLAEAGVQAARVLLARPCREVAASLLARDHSLQEASALLYVTYGIEAALQADAAVATVLRYDQLLADWRGSTDRIAADHGLDWSRTGAFLDAEVAAYLAPGAERHDAMHASPQVQAWVDAVWAWYRAASEGRLADLAPLRAIRAELEAAADTWSPLVATRRHRAKELARSEAAVRVHLADREVVLVRTAADRDELIGERDALLAQLEKQRAEALAEQERQRAEARARDQAERERSRAYDELLQERDRVLARYQAARADASDAVASRDEALRAYQHTQSELDHAQAGARRLAEDAEALRAERDKAVAAFDATDRLLREAQEAFRHAAAETDARRVERDKAVAAFDATHQLLLEAEEAFRRAAAEAEALRGQREAALHELDALRIEAIAQNELLAAARDTEARLREAGSFVERALEAMANERDDERALAAQRELELAQWREMVERADAAQAAAAVELQRRLRELESLRTELRRAQDQLAQMHASRSWRITAPLRHAVTAGRHILHVSRTTLQRPKRLLLAPPAPTGRALAPIAPAPVPAAPAFARRRHPGLRAFLAAEFGEAVAGDVLLRIDRYRLPVDTTDGRHAADAGCTPEEARSWAAELARIAAQLPPLDEQPDVSIVVPVFNQLPFTLACLESLLTHETRYRFEILVGDDASTDATALAFAAPIARVHYLCHATNLGFVRNCNTTARLARGRHLVMLNNDTVVLPGWLDELVAVLDANPEVGLVGSKLVYPDGRLQECGGIVWRDGSAWNHGRLDDPRKPEHNYLRGADFVSGASIALPSSLWRRLHGFDEHFAPAYAEDVDLAFRIRAQGLYTLVQPLSQVLHFEGVSAGTDLGQGMKAHQVGNLRKLRERWAMALEGHRPNGDSPALEKERDVGRRLLFIDHCTLTPNEDAGSLVAFEIMKSFRRHGYKVTFIPEDNFAHMGEDTRVLQRLGVETIYHPAYSRMEQFLEARQDPFDVIVLHRFTVGDRHLAALRAAYPRARVVFLACDLHYLREEREAAVAGDAAAQLRARRTKQRELAVVGASDAVVVYSDAEQAIVRGEAPGARVLLFPLVHDPVADPAPLADRDGVCFVGGYRHPPNVDAIRWFADQVWPLVHARCPQATLYVAGSHMTDEVRALGRRPGIEITGFVPDLEAFLARRRVNVAPLRFGAGVKGKVAASLANGLPTVGTQIAAEGMQLTAGEDILVADTAEAFADHVVELLGSDARWREVAVAGLRYAARVTSRASAHERIGQLLRDLGLPAAG